jgi:diacylglycerol O-acyltransferase
VGLVEAKLHLIPRYRQRVRFVPFELGRPVWEDDPHFNLAYHLCHAALPAPGDDAALCRLMARLMSQPLDRNRPLWETWLVDRLPDERWALVTKVHHCMVDGIAGVELLTVLLATNRDAPLPQPESWTASPRPSRAALLLDAARGLAGELGTRARRVPGAIRDLAATARSAWRTGEGLVMLGRELTATPPLSIEGSIGPNRAWAHSSASLDDVRTIRQAFGGTVNDVVLTAVAGGYRALLLARGDDADHAVVRSLVPTSTRAEGAHGVLDNRVSALLLDLPVQVADPRERLGVVRDQMREL